MENIVNRLYDSQDPLFLDFEIFTKEELEVIDEYRFWLRVMEDHLKFIIKRGGKFRSIAETHLSTATQLKNQIIENRIEDFNVFNDDVINLIETLREIKKDMLRVSVDLANNDILLPSTFISHMLNELESFRYIVYYIKITGNVPPTYMLNEHELWLADIVGHLGAIKDNMDDVERIIRKKLFKHKKTFQQLHAKTIEFISYVKHGVDDFQAVDRLTVKANEETILYLNLITELLELLNNRDALGIIDDEMLVHMILEQMYYLKKLEIAQNTYNPLQSCQIELDNTSLHVVSNMPV